MIKSYNQQLALNTTICTCKNTIVAAVDSGASDYYFPADYIRENHDLTGPKQDVGTANGSVMRLIVIDWYFHGNILERAHTCKKFIEVTLPLVSVGHLCVNGPIVEFDASHVYVLNKYGQILSTGTRDPE